MTGAREAGVCEVHKETEAPCERPAAEEIMGVPSCGPHVREQEARFSIGELVEACGVVSGWQRQAQSFGSGALLEALARTQRELDARVAEETGRPRARSPRR